MKTRMLVLAGLAALFEAVYCRAGLGNDDSWFNGSLGPAPPTPNASPVGGGWVPPPQPSGPPPPTKEELEAKDLADSSDDYVDRGNKWYKAGKWEAAIAYYKKAIRDNPDNDDAIHNLRKAQQHLADEQAAQRAAAEARIAEIRRQEEERAAAQQRLVAERDQCIQADRENYNSQLQRLMTEADHINVPPPAAPAHIHEGIMLGLFDPQDEAEKNLGGAISPFTGKPIDKATIFSSADSKTAHEALRGLLDNQTIGEYTLNTEYGKQLIERLNGTQFDRLIAHSNGATIAEALIKRGTIKVDELNIVGGDRSLINQAGYQNLIDEGRVKRIVVWINPGDVIPVGSSLRYVSPMGGVNVAPLLTSAEHAANVLTGNHQGGDGRTIEYRLLKGSEYTGQQIHTDSTIFEPHDLKQSYLPNIASYFKSNGGAAAGN
jgi:tetratricopeptide (TPR) repeat protein